MRTVRQLIPTGLMTAGLVLLAGACQPAAPNHEAALRPAVDAIREAWNAGNMDGLDAHFSADVMRRAPGAAVPSQGLDGLKAVITQFRTAYPDFRIVFDDVWYTENNAFARWTVTGTNTGPGETPPTGKAITVSGLTRLQYENGMAVMEDVYFDTMGWLQQLGYTVSPPTM